MSDNRFSDCATVADALLRYRALEVVDADDDFELTARLRQLQPSTVTAEQWERAREVLGSALVAALARKAGSGTDAAITQTLDRIIDALGWTSTSSESQTEPIFDVPTPEPATPDELLVIACGKCEGREFAASDDGLRCAKCSSPATPAAQYVDALFAGCDSVRDILREFARQQSTWGHRELIAAAERAIRKAAPATPAEPEVRDRAISGAWLSGLMSWNIDTFGPGLRTEGVTDHIARELDEIRKAPTDLTEWADVILLALAGAVRAAGAEGEHPRRVIDAVLDKHQRNLQRKWPDWRTAERGKAIEHVRDTEPADAPHQCADVADDCCERTPAPATPAVELGGCPNGVAPWECCADPICPVCNPKPSVVELDSGELRLLAETLDELDHYLKDGRRTTVRVLRIGGGDQ